MLYHGLKTYKILKNLNINIFLPNRINNILKTNGVDLLKATKNPDLQIDSTIEILGKLSVKLALTNVVKEANLRVKSVVGSPLCEAYVFGNLLFEQAVVCAYYLAQILTNSLKNDLTEKEQVGD